MPWLLSASFVTAGDNAWSIAHTVFHTSQQVITHGLSSVSYVTAANNCMVYRLFHTSQQLLRMVYRLFHTSQQLIMHGLSSVSYATESNNAWSIAHIGYLCHAAQQGLLGWSEVCFVQSTKGHWLEQGDRTQSAYCRLMLRNLYLLRGL